MLSHSDQAIRQKQQCLEKSTQSFHFLWIKHGITTYHPRTHCPEEQPVATQQPRAGRASSSRRMHNSLFGLWIADAISCSQLGRREACGHVFWLILQVSKQASVFCTLKVYIDLLLWPDTCMFGNPIICLALSISSPPFLSSLSHQG